MIEIDWHAATDELDRYGSATLKGLLARQDCEAVIDLYEDEANFRKRVAMAQHGFGRGEYKYFAYPLPALVAELRARLYPPLAGIANRWNAALKSNIRFPQTHAEYLERCHAAGQIRPTPLLLRYREDDYN